MAKNVGLIGGLRGKLGNAVFYVSNGVQVSRVYQPIVANPNTQLQIEQRSKMSLAGRMSKITPAAAIRGLFGDNLRTLRGSFVREVIRASTYSNDKASLAYDSLALSHGNLQFFTSHSYTRANSSGRIDITVSVERAAAGTPIPVGYGLRAVVYFIDNTSSDGDMCSTGLLNIPDGDTPVTTLIRRPVTRGSAANYTVAVYVVPFMATSNLDGVSYSYIGSEEDTYILINGLRSVASIRYGDSSYVHPTT